MCKCIYGHQRARANAAGDEAKGCGLFVAVDLVTHLQIAKIYTRSLQTHARAHTNTHTHKHTHTHTHTELSGDGVSGEGRALLLFKC